MRAGRKHVRTTANGVRHTARSLPPHADLVDRLLVVAHDDEQWRAMLEHLVGLPPLRARIKGGTRRSELWRPGSLARKQLRDALAGDLDCWTAFCSSHPQVYEHFNRVDESSEVPDEGTLESESPLALHSALLLAYLDADATDESLQGAMERFEEGFAEHYGVSGDEHATVEGDVGPGMVSEECRVLIERQQRELKKLHADLRGLDVDIARLKKERSAVDRSRTELKATCDEQAADLRECRKQIAALESQLRRADRDTTRLKEQIEQERSGRESVAGKRDAARKAMDEKNAEVESLCSALDDREARIEELESELEHERKGRTDLQSMFEAFGLDSIESSLGKFQQSIEMLGSIHSVMQRYAEARRVEENAAQREEETRRRLADEQRAADEEALLRQQQDEQSWRAAKESGVQAAFDELFRFGVPDNILIDGHNLILRTRRPEYERQTRPWLESIVKAMAQRLEADGHSTRIELVFDSPHPSNHHSMGHGLTVHFADNSDHRSGADERIIDFLKERHPSDSYMIVSTDMRHIWSAAEVEAAEAGIDNVDLVQVELLARYLEALERLVADEGR